MQDSLFGAGSIVGSLDERHRTPTLRPKQSDLGASMFSSMEEDENVLFGSAELSNPSSNDDRDQMGSESSRTPQPSIADESPAVDARSLPLRGRHTYHAGAGTGGAESSNFGRGGTRSFRSADAGGAGTMRSDAGAGEAAEG